MAALKEVAREYASEIRDGIGWVIVYRTGRSWHALTVWSDLGNCEHIPADPPRRLHLPAL